MFKKKAAAPEEPKEMQDARKAEAARAAIAKERHLKQGLWCLLWGVAFAGLACWLGNWMFGDAPVSSQWWFYPLCAFGGFLFGFSVNAAAYKDQHQTGWN